MTGRHRDRPLQHRSLSFLAHFLFDFLIPVHRWLLLPSHLYPMKQTLYLAKNYLTIAIRNLLRHPGYSLINLSGLALGMACAVLLAIYIAYELSYDRFRPEVARTYRVMKQTRHANGRIAWNTGQQGPLATVLPEEIPEIENATRFWAGLRWITSGEKSFQQMFWLSDPNIFAFFGIEVLTGNPQTVLQDPFSVVITEPVARKFFGSTDPIGKTITVDHNLFGGTYQITGVIRQAPHNSRFQYDFITATMPQGVRQRRSWDHWLPPAYSRPANTYLRLKPGAKPEDIASQIAGTRRTLRGNRRRRKRNRALLSPSHLAHAPVFQSRYARIYRRRGKTLQRHTANLSAGTRGILYPHNSLHQLHEPLHSPVSQPCERSGTPKSRGRVSLASHKAIFGRIPPLIRPIRLYSTRIGISRTTSIQRICAGKPHYEQRIGPLDPGNHPLRRAYYPEAIPHSTSLHSNPQPY